MQKSGSVAAQRSLPPAFAAHRPRCRRSAEVVVCVGSWWSWARLLLSSAPLTTSGSYLRRARPAAVLLLLSATEGENPGHTHECRGFVSTSP